MDRLTRDDLVRWLQSALRANEHDWTCDADRDKESALLQAIFDLALSALSQEAVREGHDEPCYYCGEPCNSLAGDPSRWPLGFPHRNEPGKLKWQHVGCVTDRLLENNIGLTTVLTGSSDAALKREPNVARIAELEKDAARWRKGVSDGEFPIRRSGQWMHVSRTSGRILTGETPEEVIDAALKDRA